MIAGHEDAEHDRGERERLVLRRPQHGAEIPVELALAVDVRGVTSTGALLDLAPAATALLSFTLPAQHPAKTGDVLPMWSASARTGSSHSGWASTTDPGWSCLRACSRRAENVSCTMQLPS